MVCPLCALLKNKNIKKMDFERCNSAAQFAIPQSENTLVIPNTTPCIKFGLNMLATGHVGTTTRIFYIAQPLSLAVFDRVLCCLSHPIVALTQALPVTFRGQLAATQFHLTFQSLLPPVTQARLIDFLYVYQP